MNKELEETINWLKSNIKYYKEQIEFIKATDCDYYDEEQSLYEKRIKIFENILNHIDNSISKKVIEERIKELENSQGKVKNNNLIYSRENVFRFQIYILEELLEGK